MIPRRVPKKVGKIPRRRGPKQAHAAAFKKGSGPNKDPRIGPGRPKGSPNKIPTDVKQALAIAMELHGNGSGRTKPKWDKDGNRVLVPVGKPGQDGRVGYWSWLLQNLPEIGAQCVQRFFATTTVTGPGGGPVQTMNVSPDIIAKMNDAQLEAFSQVIGIVNGDAIANPGEEMPGDASAYAKEIGLLPAPTEQR